MKTLVINTLENEDEEDSILLKKIKCKRGDVEMLNTAGMNINHCAGCNMCWLKSPGVCAIKDDYEQILKKIVEAENLWIISNTHFGFLDYKGKRIMDSIVPMLNMNIELRYHSLNIGVIYKSNADQQLLEEWCVRAADNLAGHSLGAYSIGGKEVLSCM